MSAIAKDLADGRPRPRAPVDQLQAGMAFYAALGLDVRHFGPMWHVMKVAQLVETDLNRISGRHGLSIADFHLLGALMMEPQKPLRPTDLALALNVSNAALTARIRKLADKGLVVGAPADGDRRVTVLQLTAKGSDVVLAIGAAIEREGHFVRYFRALPEADQQALGRILGELHTQMDRHFLPAPRGGPLGG
ncbi:MAG: MarR family transcriptional regulator [Caulobacter sp.]|nr:MarR family transcriptional regulator [Caulobacter sp.]